MWTFQAVNQTLFFCIRLQLAAPPWVFDAEVFFPPLQLSRHPSPETVFFSPRLVTILLFCAGLADPSLEFLPPSQSCDEISGDLSLLSGRLRSCSPFPLCGELPFFPDPDFQPGDFFLLFFPCFPQFMQALLDGAFSGSVDRTDVFLVHHSRLFPEHNGPQCPGRKYGGVLSPPPQR